MASEEVPNLTAVSLREPIQQRLIHDLEPIHAEDLTDPQCALDGYGYNSSRRKYHNIFPQSLSGHSTKGSIYASIELGPRLYVIRR